MRMTRRLCILLLLLIGQWCRLASWKRRWGAEAGGGGGQQECEQAADDHGGLAGAAGPGNHWQVGVPYGSKIGRAVGELS